MPVINRFAELAPAITEWRRELHLGILMETMRREGYEFAVSRPRIITKKGPDGAPFPLHVSMLARMAGFGRSPGRRAGAA